MPQLFRLAKPAPKFVLQRGRPRVSPLVDRSLHMDRDAEAFLQLLLVLQTCGFKYADTYYDWQGDFFRNSRGALLPAADLRPLAAVGPDDLLVLTTRPPLDDEEAVERKGKKGARQQYERGHVERSQTVLETQVNEAMRAIFHTLRPRQVALKRTGLQNDREWRHHQDGADFTSAGAVVLKDRPGWAVGYAAYLPRWQVQWQGGRMTTRFLAVFGMDGTTGLCWAHVLRRRLAGVLREMIGQAAPQLLIGEFTFPLALDTVPLDLGFIEDGKIECRHRVETY